MSPVELEHIRPDVSDLEAAITWYRDCFDFEVVKRFGKPELEVR